MAPKRKRRRRDNCAEAPIQTQQSLDASSIQSDTTEDCDFHSLQPSVTTTSEIWTEEMPFPRCRCYDDPPPLGPNLRLCFVCRKEVLESEGSCMEPGCHCHFHLGGCWGKQSSLSQYCSAHLIESTNLLNTKTLKVEENPAITLDVDKPMEGYNGPFATIHREIGESFIECVRSTRELDELRQDEATLNTKLREVEERIVNVVLRRDEKNKAFVEKVKEATGEDVEGPLALGSMIEM